MNLTRRLYVPDSEIGGNTTVSLDAKPREEIMAVVVYRPSIERASVYHPAMSDSHTGTCPNVEVEQVFRHGDRLGEY